MTRSISEMHALVAELVLAVRERLSGDEGLRPQLESLPKKVAGESPESQRQLAEMPPLYRAYAALCAAEAALADHVGMSDGVPLPGDERGVAGGVDVAASVLIVHRRADGTGDAASSSSLEPPQAPRSATGDGAAVPARRSLKERLGDVAPILRPRSKPAVEPSSSPAGAARSTAPERPGIGRAGAPSRGRGAPEMGRHAEAALRSLTATEATVEIVRRQSAGAVAADGQPSQPDDTVGQKASGEED
jgi:hypothetical protein